MVIAFFLAFMLDVKFDPKFPVSADTKTYLCPDLLIINPSNHPFCKVLFAVNPAPVFPYSFVLLSRSCRYMFSMVFSMAEFLTGRGFVE